MLEDHLHVTEPVSQQHVDGPVLLRLELGDLRVALADQAQGHRLHTAGGKSGVNDLP